MIKIKDINAQIQDLLLQIVDSDIPFVAEIESSPEAKAKAEANFQLLDVICGMASFISFTYRQNLKDGDFNTAEMLEEGINSGHIKKLQMSMEELKDYMRASKGKSNGKLH